jgi:hypothetical protein
MSNSGIQVVGASVGSAMIGLFLLKKISDFRKKTKKES